MTTRRRLLRAAGVAGAGGEASVGGSGALTVESE
jgi:hypothetical protein